jgi:hypothetical protein
MTERDLPPEISRDAHLAGNEYGWVVSSFPSALTNAEAIGYACLGGQFQFRLDEGTCEMYWLSADSNSRREGETWKEYSKRSCCEVKHGFEKLLFETDFLKQGLEWFSVRGAMTKALDPMEKLFFVAYFVDEAEWQELQQQNRLSNDRK